MPQYLWIEAPKGDRYYYLAVSYQSLWAQRLGGTGPVQYVPRTFTVPGGFFSSCSEPRLEEGTLTWLLFIKASNYQREFY